MCFYMVIYLSIGCVFFLYYLHAILQNIYMFIFLYMSIVEEKIMQTCAHLLFESSCIIFAITIAHESGVAPICCERKKRVL